MTPEEQTALEQLHKECDTLRKNAFWAMRHDMDMNAQELSNSGYKTNEAAVIGSFKYYLKQIDKLTKEHLKAFPD